MRRLERKHGPGFVFTDMKLEFSIGLLLQKRKLTVNELNLVSYYLCDIAELSQLAESFLNRNRNRLAGFSRCLSVLPNSKGSSATVQAEFEEAFYLQEKAKERGERIAATDLARKLTKYEFRCSETSAFRGMQRGIGRVRVEHQRLIQLGIKSPFLAPRTAESGRNTPRRADRRNSRTSNPRLRVREHKKIVISRFVELLRNECYNGAMRKSIQNDLSMSPDELVSRLDCLY